jgi:pyruvate,orthophosphate dikinase
MGKCCVAAVELCTSKEAHAKDCEIGGVHINEGDWITIDDTTGEVFQGLAANCRTGLSGSFGTKMEWLERTRY